MRPILLGWLLLPGVLGCGGRNLPVADLSPLPLRSATEFELVSAISHAGDSPRGLKGKLSLGLQRGPDAELRECSGMIACSNDPGMGLYLKGYKRLIPTVFTLVSDGREFWFHIPSDDVVYTGPLDASWGRHDSLDISLNARDLFRAFFVQPLEAGDSLAITGADSLYALTVRNQGVVVRRVWLERRRFAVVREIYYGLDGRADLEIQRREYADLEGRLYPSRFVLRDLRATASVYLDFNSLTLDPDDLPVGIFRFAIPPGTETKRVPTGPEKT